MCNFQDSYFKSKGTIDALMIFELESSSTYFEKLDIIFELPQIDRISLIKYNKEDLQKIKKDRNPRFDKTDFLRSTKTSEQDKERNSHKF